MRKIIEERLIQFGCDVYSLLDSFDNSYATNYLSQQLIRSAMSAALNYGESQGSESKRDFIHKSSLVLKELRESHIMLQILNKLSINDSTDGVNKLLDESNQLVAIFYKTVETAKSNLSP